MRNFDVIMIELPNGELLPLKLPFGLTIERDLYVKDGATVRDLCDEEPEYTEPAEEER